MCSGVLSKKIIRELSDSFRYVNTVLFCGLTCELSMLQSGFSVVWPFHIINMFATGFGNAT